LNIAFPAVLLFALLFPGIVFYHFYQDREVREADFTPFSRALFIAILAACILNATTTAIVHFGWGYNILVGDILRLLIGGSSPSAQVSLNAATLRLNEHPFQPIGFLFISIFLAIASSLGWRWGVRGLGLVARPLRSNLSYVLALRGTTSFGVSMRPSSPMQCSSQQSSR
jgi:hypothetical protein